MSDDGYPLYVHRETERAWLVSETGDDSDATIWLPKSQVETDERNVAIDKQESTIYEFTVPEWLAREKGLI